ncbi:MAG: Lrp/AsnC family transcriptional regulator [Bacteroidetes bacterium]|nr:Lrp/AsnC family transcriptional regulator [Bacteroidota bacterium]
MLDDIDIKILNAVQANGRVRRSDLAELVGLSLPAASERLRKLEDRGYITGYTARLDPAKFGKDVTAFVQVFVDTSRHYENFLKHVDANPEILECHAVTGEGSHLLKIRTGSTAALERILSRIQSWKEVQRTITSVVLSTRKETLTIPIPDSFISL